MCPTVPGHVVPPKNSPPRVERANSATSQRNAAVRMSTGQSNHNTRPNSAKSPTTTTGSNIKKENGKHFSNISNLHSRTVFKPINGIKSSTSSSSSASSLTHHQPGQSSSSSVISKSHTATVIEEVDVARRPVTNKRLMSARLHESKTPRLNKTQRSNSISSLGPCKLTCFA